MRVTYYNSSMFHTYLDGDKAWDLIEKKLIGYNVDVDDLYPEHFKTEQTALVYGDNLKSMLLEGEEYHLFDGIRDNYCITSFGRVINAKYKTQNCVYFASDKISVSIRAIKVWMADEFMTYGWHYDIDNIKQIYDENKWGYKWKGIQQN